MQNLVLNAMEISMATMSTDMITVALPWIFLIGMYAITSGQNIENQASG